MRFGDKACEMIQESRWWEKDRQTLAEMKENVWPGFVRSRYITADALDMPSSDRARDCCRCKAFVVYEASAK